MATWQLQIAIWTFKMAIWKLKNEHFEAQKGQNWQNAAFEPPMFQNDTPPILGQILYLALVPFFKESGQTKGGPTRPPQEATICSTDAFWS